jgi:hypothetical protein
MLRNLAAIAVLLLASCASPVIRETPANLRAYNSAWHVVAEATVNARALDTDAALADYVAEYNATHTDDQLFLIPGEEMIPMEEAPLAKAYVVQPATHEVLVEYQDVPRAELSERRETWRKQAYADGGTLYVDKIPPAPVPVIDDRPEYEKWALYLIAADGTIIAEEHAPTEDEYLARREVYYRQAYADNNGSYVVAGQLYPIVVAAAEEDLE